MNIGKINERRRGFTLVEGVVVVFVLALVALLVMAPKIELSMHEARRHTCIANLKLMGIAARVWEGNHDDKYPMEVPAALGGAQEMMATGNVVACFQVMSNELSTPRILICPQDAGHRADTNRRLDVAWARLSRTNISYFIGLDAVESDPQAMLSGDANLVQHGRVVGSGIVDLTTNITTWTTDRHGRTGFVLIADGSVQGFWRMGSTNTGGWYAPTNRVVAP